MRLDFVIALYCISQLFTILDQEEVHLPFVPKINSN